MAHSSFTKGPFDEKGGHLMKKGANGHMAPSRLNTETVLALIARTVLKVKHVIKGKIYKGINRKMTILWSFSCNFLYQTQTGEIISI